MTLLLKIPLFQYCLSYLHMSVNLWIIGSYYTLFTVTDSEIFSLGRYTTLILAEELNWGYRVWGQSGIYETQNEWINEKKT